MNKKLLKILGAALLLSGCSIHSSSNDAPPTGDQGPVVKFDMSQCPVVAGKFSRDGGTDQLAIVKSGSALKVRDRGVEFSIDGHQYMLDGGNSYVGTCFQNSIRVLLKTEGDKKASNDMIMYTNSSMTKNGVNRSVFEDGKMSEAASYVPVLEI